MTSRFVFRMGFSFSGNGAIAQFCLAAAVAFGCPGQLEGSTWDGPVFATPVEKALAAAAAARWPEEVGVVVLRRDLWVSITEDHRVQTRQRLVYHILAPNPHSEWTLLSCSWDPWYQDKPVCRARVITQAQEELWLDPSTVTESASRQVLPNVFSSRKELTAPLPGLRTGSVVEIEILTHDREPFFEAGVLERFFLDAAAPVLEAKVEVTAPASLPFRYRVGGWKGGDPEETRTSDMVRLRFEAQALEAARDYDPMLSQEVPQRITLTLSTARSWQEVARIYSERVNRQIKAGGVSRLAAELAGQEDPRDVRIEKVVRRVHQDVRYASLAIDETAIIPRSPAAVLASAYGDCKDKATLIVALLRELEIESYVALTLSGLMPFEPDLPGLAFDHVLVHVAGREPVWIEPTEPRLPVGALPPRCQGRPALIARPDTVGLEHTPESAAADNRSHEIREIELPELGRAKILERTEAWGALALEYRQHFGEASGAQIAESLRSYVANSYLTEHFNLLDFSKHTNLTEPFGLTLAIEGSPTAVVDGQEGVVLVTPAVVANDLSWPLRWYQDNETNRWTLAETAGLVLPFPFIKEWRYQVTTPPGYRAAHLPDPETRQLGPYRLTTETSQPREDQVAFTIRLEAPERRFNSHALRDLRTALDTEAWQPLLLRFEHAGESHLAQGRVREALTEFRRLAALHPGGALHRVRIARALLAGGLGEAARQMIEEALALEPASALAWAARGWILQHDLVGRRFGSGADREAALAAYRKAVGLDVEELTSARADLAILLEHDVAGNRYSEPQDLAEAIDLYRGLLKDAEPEDPLWENLAFCFLHAERFSDLRAQFKNRAKTPTLECLNLAASAATDGPEAALREARRVWPDQGAMSQHLGTVAQYLILVRRYPEAAAFAKAAAQIHPDSAVMLVQASRIAAVQRHENHTLPPNDPCSVVPQLMKAAFLAASPTAILQLMDPELSDRLPAEARQQVLREPRILFTLMATKGVPPSVAVDLVLSLLKSKASGRQEVGHRVEVRFPDQPDNRPLALYVIRKGEGFRIAADGSASWQLGWKALQRMRAANPEEARQWLEWAAQELQAPGESARRPHPFLELWTPEFRKDSSGFNTAAAVLLAGSPLSDEALPLLEAAREAGPSPPVAELLDEALAAAYAQQKQNEKLLRVGHRLLAADRGTPFAFPRVINALLDLDRGEEATRLVDDRLAQNPEDPWALRVAASTALRQGDVTAAVRWLQQLVDAGKAEAPDLNNLAWYLLTAGQVDSTALQHAQRAVLLSKGTSTHSLHTLAALYAELGQCAESLKCLHQSLTFDLQEAPDSDDWYVCGRLAEQYGETQAARAAYAKVIQPEQARVDSSFVLARRRLAAMTTDEQSDP